MSSSFRATGKSPTQRVPSWKRLGLKLRPASDDDTHHDATTTTASPTSSMPNGQTHLNGATPNGKRRASGGPPADNSVKRAKQDRTPSHQGPKKAKSVSFTADTAAPAGKTKQQNSAKNTAKTASTKRTKSSTPVNLEPALTYLRTWHTARESWKFNKNHQTKLLEHVFADANGSTIPAVDIDVFYEYIRGLQGGVRARLRELASGIHAQDIEQGAAGFPGTDAAERRQKEYEEVIAKFLGQPRTPGKRLFAEVDYVLRTTDMEMQRRVVKRMRAEVVLDELGADDSTSTGNKTANAASTSADTGKNRANASTADGEMRLQLNDGPQQRTKRKRKARTAVVEDDTSSESSSSSEDESDSDTSSSGSSSSSSSSSGGSSSDDSDGDGDGDGVVPASRANEDTSSSSSSSSESESESDDEED